MAEEIAELGLKINSKQVLEATKRLDKLEKSGKKAERASDGLSRSFGVLKGAIGAAAILKTASAIAQTADRFQKLNARLITATGSQEAANAAFENMKNLAFEMPGGIDDVTNSFIMLKNLGLNPSREALVSYGNTAAAMGKDLNQLIEAVADAATGEFERLKEFGIKTKNQGDTVAFTFRGMTTEVENSATSIENFLIGLGENEFAGAMAQQNDTIGASFMDLSDSIAIATAKLSEESGFTNAISSTAKSLGLLVRELSGTEALSDFETRVKTLKEEQTKWNEEIQNAQKLAEEQKDKGLIEKFFGPSPDAIIANANNQLMRINAQLKESEANLKSAKETAMEAAAAEPEEKVVSFEKELERLKNETATRMELLDREYEERQMLIDEALLTEQLSRQEHEDLMYRIQSEYAEKRKALEDQSNTSRLAMAQDIFGKLSSLMSSQSRELFQIGKVASIANATIKGYESVLNSYAEGTKIGGPILGGIYAGVAAITAGAQISAIANTEYGSGGQTPTPGSNSVPTAPPVSAPPPTSQKGEATIVVSGGLHSDEDVRNLVERISEVQKDMGGAATLNIA